MPRGDKKMTNWKEHEELQKAVHTYLSEHGLILNSAVVYESGIDCVYILIQDNPVLIVGLPPVSNYDIEETEYTERFLRVA